MHPIFMPGDKRLSCLYIILEVQAIYYPAG